jgi:hypothetical protein
VIATIVGRMTHSHGRRAGRRERRRRCAHRSVHWPHRLWRLAPTLLLLRSEMVLLLVRLLLLLLPLVIPLGCEETSSAGHL